MRMPLNDLKATFSWKVDWRQKQVQCLAVGNKPFPWAYVSYLQVRSKDLYTCFWSVQTFLQFYNTKMCFQVLSKDSCLKIWKQNRSEIPSPNPLLPLSNYSLPADKLQVCYVCLGLLGYNRWSKACVCWAGCQFLTGSAIQVHITLPGTTKTPGEWMRLRRVLRFKMNCPENFTRRKVFFLHHWELVTLYKRLKTASCTRKTECSPL